MDINELADCTVGQVRKYFKCFDNRMEIRAVEEKVEIDFTVLGL